MEEERYVLSFRFEKDQVAGFASVEGAGKQKQAGRVCLEGKQVSLQDLR